MYESRNGLLVCDTAGVGCGAYRSWRGCDTKLTPLPKTQQSTGGLGQQVVVQVGKEHVPPAKELFHIDRHSYRCISATNE